MYLADAFLQSYSGYTFFVFFIIMWTHNLLRG